MKGCLQGPSPLEGLALRSGSPPAPHSLHSPLPKQSPLGGGQPSHAGAAYILIPRPQMGLACRATLQCWWPVSPPLSETSQMTDTSDEEPFTASCSTAHPRPQPFAAPSFWGTPQRFQAEPGSIQSSDCDARREPEPGRRAGVLTPRGSSGKPRFRA